MKIALQSRRAVLAALALGVFASLAPTQKAHASQEADALPEGNITMLIPVAPAGGPTSRSARSWRRPAST